MRLYGDCDFDIAGDFVPVYPYITLFSQDRGEQQQQQTYQHVSQVKKRLILTVVCSLPVFPSVYQLRVS